MRARSVSRSPRTVTPSLSYLGESFAAVFKATLAVIIGQIWQKKKNRPPYGENILFENT